MIDIETMNEQCRQCKKIAHTQFLVKKKEIKNLKNGEKKCPGIGIYTYYSNWKQNMLYIQNWQIFRKTRIFMLTGSKVESWNVSVYRTKCKKEPHGIQFLRS